MGVPYRTEKKGEEVNYFHILSIKEKAHKECSNGGGEKGGCSMIARVSIIVSFHNYTFTSKKRKYKGLSIQIHATVFRRGAYVDMPLSCL